MFSLCLWKFPAEINKAKCPAVTGIIVVKMEAVNYMK